MRQEEVHLLLLLLSSSHIRAAEPGLTHSHSVYFSLRRTHGLSPPSAAVDLQLPARWAMQQVTQSRSERSHQTGAADGPPARWGLWVQVQNLDRKLLDVDCFLSETADRLQLLQHLDFSFSSQNSFRSGLLKVLRSWHLSASVRLSNIFERQWAFVSMSAHRSFLFSAGVQISLTWSLLRSRRDPHAQMRQNKDVTCSSLTAGLCFAAEAQQRVPRWEGRF